MRSEAFHAALAVCLLAAGSAAAQGFPLEPPFAVDCSPTGERGEIEEREALERRRAGAVRVLPDRRYGARWGYGHETGEGFRPWFAVVAGIWGTREPDLFAGGRIDPESYRFDVPRGDYIVALGFAEIEEHRAGRRVFDVRIQGEVAARGVDPFAIAGFAQAFRLVFPATVERGGRLTIIFERAPGSPRPPLVNAIWVYPRRERREAEGPRPPPGFRGFGSYRMNVLFWDHPEDERVAGYIIERRRRGEERFAALTPAPVPVSRWIDAEAAPGVEHEYRIASVDAGGHRGPASDAVRLMPRSPDDSPLPVYSVEVAPDDLLAVLAEVGEDRRVDGAFRFQGAEHAIRLRLRGASSRNAAKLGYRIEFRERSPFGSRKVIFLRAHPSDHTLQQEKLTCDVFRRLGLPVSEARYINLFINGRYQGVHVDLEPIDGAFIGRLGFAGGDLLRSGSFQGLDGKGPRNTVLGDRDSLEELLRRVNRLERGEFEAFARAALDWPLVRDYLAASLICHRSEIEADDFFYYRDRASGRWLLVPWDHNNGNFGVPGCGLEVGRPFMPLFGQTLQGIGHRRDYWYVLPSRLFQHDGLRREYLDRVEELARDLLLSEKIDGLIDENFAALRPEMLIDPFRWPPGRDEPFLRSASELKEFSRRHGERLLRLIEAERGRREPPVVIEEFQIGAESGWVELRNRSGEPVSLERCVLGSLRPWRPWRRFAAADRLGPGELRVFEFSPRGDALALLGPRQWVDAAAGKAGGEEGEREREREEEETDSLAVIDWFASGARAPGFSYGRLDGGFAFLEPTPGRPNAGPAALPPPLIEDSSAAPRENRRIQISARIVEIVPSAPPARITLRYVFGSSGGSWLEAPMEIETGDGRPRAARAALPPAAAGTIIRYYFIAEAASGLERRSPLSAPEDTFTRRIKNPDD